MHLHCYVWLYAQYSVSVYSYMRIFMSVCNSASSLRYQVLSPGLHMPSKLHAKPPPPLSKSELSQISVSRVPWVDNMFFLCVRSISPTVLWFLLLMKWIGWPLLRAHSAQCSNLSCCENALRLGGVTSTRLLTHNTSALLSRQPYPTAPMLL